LWVKGVLVDKVHGVERAVQEESDGISEIWRDANALNIEERSGSRSEKLLDALFDLVLVGCTRERYPTNLSYPSWVELKNEHSKHLSSE
jgi:hypothetical protein